MGPILMVVIKLTSSYKLPKLTVVLYNLLRMAPKAFSFKREFTCLFKLQCQLQMFLKPMCILSSTNQMKDLLCIKGMEQGNGT